MFKNLKKVVEFDDIDFIIMQEEETNNLLLVSNFDNKLHAQGIESINDIFKIIPAEELSYSFIPQNIFDMVIDDKVLLKKKFEKDLYKIFFYDDIFTIAKRLITKYIKDNKLDTELLHESHSPEDYFTELWSIEIDVDRNEVTFEGVSAYIDIYCYPSFSLNEISVVLDIDKLLSVLTKMNNSKVRNIKLECIEYGTDSRIEIEYSPLFINVDGNTLYTYDVFSNDNWNGDFRNFIKK